MQSAGIFIYSKRLFIRKKLCTFAEIGPDTQKCLKVNLVQMKNKCGARPEELGVTL